MRALLVALVVLVPAVTAAPTGAWDGCTGASGDARFSAADGTKLVGHRFGRGLLGPRRREQKGGLSQRHEGRLRADGRPW